MQPSAGPWLSPNVVTVNNRPIELPDIETLPRESRPVGALNGPGRRTTPHDDGTLVVDVRRIARRGFVGLAEHLIAQRSWIHRDR